MLEVKSLTKTYQSHTALENFSTSIKKQQIYGLLGPNGAGKTTFIRILNQIIEADKGEIYIDGKKLSKEHISKIGYMPEERGLYKNMNIWEQCLYFGQLKGIPLSRVKEKTVFWLKKMEIENWKNKKLGELSKGMAQKIQFIISILHNPELIIFDEPFSGLDPVNASLITKEILNLRDEGATIIFSTHRMETVEFLCDHVCMIYKSHKILDDTLYKVKEKYKSNIIQVRLSNIEEEKFENFKKEYQIEKIELAENNSTSFLLHSDREDFSTKKVIGELLKTGEIKQYNELIPNMQEIFIRSIEQQSAR